MTQLLHANDIDPPIPAAGPYDEFADLDLLHSISIELIGEQDRFELYGKIVDAAIAITRSQFGTMQLLCPANDPSGHGGELQLLSHRGLPPEAIRFWQWVKPTAYSSCTRALKSRARAIIPDYELWDEMAATEDLIAFRRAGIRSAQTTPLLSRDGSLLGMISTHWNEVHEPSERDLRLLDILARQAADLLERTIAEEALRAREAELERTCAMLRETEELQKMLTGELSHRVKNMLATVQAIASQTLRSTDDPAAFAKSFGGRIQSMSRVHSQLSDNDWKGTLLADIVHDQMKLGPVDESQILASGPSVRLDATAVPKMAMLLHELGTNSLKYGALSRQSGEVSISWRSTQGMLHLSWSERGGPPVAGPIKRGFGTRLIEASVNASGGSASMATKPEGICWTIAFPLTAEMPHPDPVPQQILSSDVAGTRDHASSDTAWSANRLAGKRILLVEDEPLLALEIAGELEEAGAHVIGPAADVATALGLIERYRFEAALLDANLAGHPVDEIAALLARQNVPFLFISGYGRASLPIAFPDVDLLAKPFDGPQLLKATAALVD